MVLESKDGIVEALGTGLGSTLAHWGKSHWSFRRICVGSTVVCKKPEWRCVWTIPDNRLQGKSMKEIGGVRIQIQFFILFKGCETRSWKGSWKGVPQLQNCSKQLFLHYWNNHIWSGHACWNGVQSLCCSCQNCEEGSQKI